MAQLGKLIERLPLPIVPPSLKIGREIDRGAWGTVHEGEFGGRSVAVKKVHKLLQEAEDGARALRSFFQECKRLKDLDHPHVIKFRGAYKDELGPILVMERMDRNLRRFLEKNQDRVTIQEQIRISLEITQGVAFLHQLNPPMVHRDLNDKNVMFTFDGVAKIGDFGQSRLKQDLYLTSDQPGMVPFMPPEALGDGNSKYDESLDMFSLGVLMLEIGTQRQPMSSIVGIGVTPEIKRREKDLQIMGDLHPLKPFILLCLSDDQKQRPKATDMCRMLSRMDVDKQQMILAAKKRLLSQEDEANGSGSEYEAVIAKMIKEVTERITCEEEMKSQFQRQIAALLIALKGTREEIAARKEHEAELTFQLQANTATCQEAEGRVQQLEAELDVAKQKCNDLEHQVAEVHDDMAKQKAVSDAESDKGQLIEANEHFRQANESLRTLLCEKEATIKRLEEDLRGTKGLFEAMNDELAQQLQKDEEEMARRLKQSDQLKAMKKLKHEDKKTEKEKKLFGKHSKLDKKSTSLKEVFVTIVKKKDNEILMQIDEIKELRRQVETFEELLLEKCRTFRALQIENSQLRETYCLPDKDPDDSPLGS